MYEQMLQERNRLEHMNRTIQKQLSTLPEGRLIYSRDGNRCKFYHQKDQGRTYLSKDFYETAEKLALKRYLTALSKDICQEKTAIDFYLKHHTQKMLKSEQLLIDLPEYRNLLSKYFTPVSQELTDWQNSSYEHNPKHPEHLIHKSVSGNVVRSKSEVLIDMMLYTNRIPYRYECALQLGDITLYPDFTIRHPKTGKIFYWEHFGKMDDPGYCKSTCSKLQLYMTHGMIPSINLITTYETQNTPLAPNTVKKLVQEHFGNSPDTILWYR